MPGMGSGRVIAVGAFLIGGVLLFTLGLFLIGDRRGLFEDTFEVYAEFGRVSGLENGAIVRVGGVAAGEVLAIEVPPRPSAKFRVKARVREDLHGIVRTDSVASIQNDGLVGNKFLQIDAGTDQAPPVPHEGTIQSREPFDFPELLKQMSETITLVNATITDLRADVEQALGSVTATVRDAQGLLNVVGADVKRITDAGVRIAADTREVMEGVRAGRGTVGKLVTDEALYEQAKRIVADGEKVVANLREAAEQAKQAINDFRGKEGPVQGITADFRETLAYARDAMADLAENAEALKHSFFFRGYFNRRGYFDLDDLSVEEYRRGALGSKTRRPLRVWLDARVLFSTDAKGSEELSDGGRARLDSAMAQFLKYPLSPMVIEGYAGGASEDARYLASRHRAQIVRAYLVGRFHLDTNRIGLMAMGSQAPGSPTGDTWKGVALAIFIER
jgi:phospholipid/cholesterol/gamma-HCH transport system substrate-binding protein